MFAHFALDRSTVGKTRQEIASEEIFGPYRPMAQKRSEIST